MCVCIDMIAFHHVDAHVFPVGPSVVDGLGEVAEDPVPVVRICDSSAREPRVQTHLESDFPLPYPTLTVPFLLSNLILVFIEMLNRSRL